MARQINDIVLTGNGLLVTFDDNFSQQLVWEYVDGVLSLTDGKRIIAESVLDEIKSKSVIDSSSSVVWSYLFGSYGKPLDVTSITAGSITAGSITAASVAASGSVTAASVAASGSVTAASLGVTGSVTAGSLGVTGSVTAGSVETASLIADSIKLDVANQDVKISRSAANTIRMGLADDSIYFDETYSGTTTHAKESKAITANARWRFLGSAGHGFDLLLFGANCTIATTNTSSYTLIFGGSKGFNYNNNWGVAMSDNYAMQWGNARDCSIAWNTQSTGSDHMLFGTSSHFLFQGGTSVLNDYEHVDTTAAIYIHSITAAATATDQYLRLLHDTTDAVIESGAGDIALNPASGALHLNNVGMWILASNGFTYQIDAVNSTNLFSFYDGAGDGLRVQVLNSTSQVLVSTESNGASTDIHFGALVSSAERNDNGLRYTQLPGFSDQQKGLFAAKLHYSRFVEVNTAIVASPNVLTDGESGNVITNEGATAENHHDLPTAAAGLQYTFIVQDVDGIQVNAAAGDTIRIGGTVSASGGFISSATIGNTITIVAINTTEWVATTSIGTWTFDV